MRVYNLDKILTTRLTDDEILNLKAGDSVLISGLIYTARDVTHKSLLNFWISEGSAPLMPGMQ